ncbi:adenosylcobinamide-phosphate synthase CbiB [Natrialbaceae archaeon A-gly3]
MTATTLAPLGAIALAVSLDALLGEPPNAAHPVAWFGRLIGHLDREWTEGDGGQRAVGVAIAAFAPLLAAGAIGGAVLAISVVHPLAGAVAAGLVLYLTTSLRMLVDLAESVLEATEVDLETARESLLGLAGRDASELSPAQIRSAAVESAGENLADGLVSTLLPFALLAPISLPLAAAAAAWVKAVNTLDSMLGYRSKPIGTASARLDDIVMWIPARVAALAIAVAALEIRALSRGRRWAHVPSSPNSGWPMATLACSLEVRLEKPGVYVLNDDAPLPGLEDGRRAVALVGRAGAVCVLLAAGLALLSAAVLATSGTTGGQALEAGAGVIP